MKKTYLITVLVDKFTTLDSYKDIEWHWVIPVTVTASSKSKALREAHDTAREKAQLDYGTSLGSWRTTIYMIDQVASTPLQKIND